MWPVIGQFSSIGSLGAAPDRWLTGEFLDSLMTVKKSANLSRTKTEEHIKLVSLYDFISGSPWLLQLMRIAVGGGSTNNTCSTGQGLV